MSDLEDLSNAVKNRKSSSSVPHVIVRDPEHGAAYPIVGFFLFLWTAICLVGAGRVVYVALVDDRPPTLAEMGFGYGLASDTRVPGAAPVVVEHVKNQRIGEAVIFVGGIGLAWAIIATPMALVMIASKG